MRVLKELLHKTPRAPQDFKAPVAKRSASRRRTSGGSAP